MESKDYFNNLSDFEKIQFLQYEYEWQRKRKEDVINRAQNLLGWNCAIFAFFIAFVDINSIVLNLKNQRNLVIFILLINLIILVIIAIVMLIISSYILLNSIVNNKVLSFEMEDNVNNCYNFKQIEKDYLEIIKDYDVIIEEINKKISNGIKLMTKSVSILLVSELLLKIIINL